MQVDFEKAQIKPNFNSINHSEILLNETQLILPTKDIQRCFYLMEMIMHQTENVTLIGSIGSGKSTVIKCISQKVNENSTIGWIQSGQLIDRSAVKQYVDTFYVVKKKNVATPLSWKQVIFIVEDVNMCYPTSKYSIY